MGRTIRVRPPVRVPDAIRDLARRGPTATERHLLADVRLLAGVTLVVSPSADEGRPDAHAEYRPSASSDAPDRRIRHVRMLSAYDRS